MPNGDIVSFPDDMPKERIREIIATKFPETIPQKDFFQRTGDNILKRANEVADSIVSYKSGDQGLGQTALQVAGKGLAAPLNDIFAETARSAYRSLPPEISEPIDAAGRYVAQSSVGKMAGKVAEEYGEFAKDNPNAARSIESAGNIAAFIPGMEMVSRGGKAVKQSGQSAVSGGKAAVTKTKTAAKDFKQFREEGKIGAAAPDSAARVNIINRLADEHGAAYDAARASGMSISPQASAKILMQVKAALKNSGEKFSFGSGSSVKSRLDEWANKVKAGEPFDISDVINLKTDLNSLYGGAEGGLARKVKKAVESGYGKLTEADIVKGDPTGLKLLREADNKFMKTQRYTELSKLGVSAEKAADPVQALYNQLKTFTANPKNMKRLNENEIAALNAINPESVADAVGGGVSKLGMGSRGIVSPLVSSYVLQQSGLGKSAIVSPVVGMIMKNARVNAARGRYEKALQTVLARDTSAANSVAPAPPLALPAPKAKYAEANIKANMENANRLAATEPDIFVDWDGNARQGIPQTKPVFDANRIEYANSGMPEVANAQFNAVLNKELPLRSGSEVGAAAINRDNFYRPMGAWLKPADPPAPPAGTLSEIFYREFQRAKDADMTNAPMNIIKDNIAAAITPQPTVKPFSAEIVARNAAAKAGGQAELGAVGQALLEALSAPKKKPLKITVTKDPNIGADGLPKVNLP